MNLCYVNVILAGRLLVRCAKIGYFLLLAAEWHKGDATLLQLLVPEHQRVRQHAATIPTPTHRS
jgi:hypothetical protein